jgi:endo-1,4-beta-xylanase
MNRWTRRAAIQAALGTRSSAKRHALGRSFLDLTLDFREVNAVLCWGLADHYSWLQGRTPRGDGLPKRPTPYDA